MPRRRVRSRPKKTAAGLQASRLPAGATHLSNPRPPLDTRSFSGSSAGSHGSGSSEDRKPTSRSTTQNPASKGSTTMAPRQPPHNPARSLAEAKLERQRKRIEDADAALTAPLILPDRTKQPSRGKNKQWKPFDFTAETTSPHHPASIDGGVPVSEVRINTFRAPSRGSSLNRSMSVLSNRTSETGGGPSGMERHESIFTDNNNSNNGFQLYMGRRHRKDAGELSAYETKHTEERQTTVEATFDKREIYEVFGNALPGPEYLEENIGLQAGQLQFIQHPNGDVSAHQWSTERYMWENIGQYSNIRKKVEGQLAADRLKGETAYQTLQQHTLAYFRTVAKQREANVMGLPFGAKEIRDAMPEPAHAETVTAPAGPKIVSQDIYKAESEHSDPRTAIWHPTELSERSEQPAVKSVVMPSPPTYTSRPSRPNNSLNYTSIYGQQGNKQDDPFYSGSTSTYQQIYGAQPYTNYYNPLQPASRSPWYGVNEQYIASGHNNPFGSTALLSQPTPPVYPQYNTQSAFGERFTRTLPQPSVDRTQGSRTGPESHHLGATTTQQSKLGEGLGARFTTGQGEAASHQRPVTPSSTRPSQAVRDQIFKLPEVAKSRNNSQANIRTVLYDPYQAQQTSTKDETDDEKPAVNDAAQEGQEPPPNFVQHLVGKTLQPPINFDSSPSRFFPTTLAPQLRDQQPAAASSPTKSSMENNLKDSSPDTQWTKKPCEHTTPLIVTGAELKPTPQNFKGPFFTDVQDVTSPPALTKSSSSGSKKSYDEELHDWWTSGINFARQEEFYQSIKASSKGAQADQKPSFNETTTRVLIPVLENLAGYVQGPAEQRRDYFCPWVQPPEWCIDRSEGGNNSFYDADWGRPPARVGRDPRYSVSGSYSGRGGVGRSTDMGAAQVSPIIRRRVGSGVTGTPGGSSALGAPIGYGSPGGYTSGGVPVGSGLDRRFGFVGRY